MIPGVVAYGGLPSASAPVAFKGVAMYSATSHLEVFQDNGATWTRVFDLVDSAVRTIELTSNDLMVCRTSYPYFRVYSWNGTTFAETWFSNTTPFNNSIPSSATISYDGNTILYGTSAGGFPYGSAGIRVLTRGGDGGYSALSAVDTSVTPDSVATNGDGTVLFGRRGNASSAGIARYSSGSWGSFSGVGSSLYGGAQPSASSRTGTSIYMSTLSTSSPYLCMYRHIVSTGANSRLSNFSIPPPSSLTGTSTDVSYDGMYVAFGYYVSSMQSNGGIRVYSRTSDTAFNNIMSMSSDPAIGRISGVSFSSDGTKLYGARAFAGTTTENVWVWTRSGSTWTQTGSIKCNSYFSQSSLERRLISAN